MTEHTLNIYNKDNQVEKIGSLTFLSQFVIPVELPSVKIKKVKKEKVNPQLALMNGMSPYFL